MWATRLRPDGCVGGLFANPLLIATIFNEIGSKESS